MQYRVLSCDDVCSRMERNHCADFYLLSYVCIAQEKKKSSDKTLNAFFVQGPCAVCLEFGLQVL